VPTLDDHEAQLLLAKRMLAKRVVEDLDPIYPFNKQSIYELNEEVMGNPRQLLVLTDKIIDAAAAERMIQIDEDYIKNFIQKSKGQELLPPAPKGKVQQHIAKAKKDAQATPKPSVHQPVVRRAIKPKPELADLEKPQEAAPPASQPIVQTVEQIDCEPPKVPGASVQASPPPAGTILPKTVEATVSDTMTAGRQLAAASVQASNVPLEKRIPAQATETDKEFENKFQQNEPSKSTSKDYSPYSQKFEDDFKELEEIIQSISE
jgi:hypothetical protein